jgi:hypothetical protein
MNFQDTNSSAGILVRHLQKHLLIGILCLFAATGIIFVPPRIVAQAAPHAAPSAPQPEKKSAKPLRAVEAASREELLNVIEKQRKVIRALETRVKELEQSARSADAQERNKR